MFTQLAVLPREQVVGQTWGVCQAQQDGGEACIAQLVESRYSSLPLLPVCANLLQGKEDPCGRVFPLAMTAGK